MNGNHHGGIGAIDFGPRPTTEPAPPVTPAQRFTRDHPCPVCGGNNAQLKGRGKRCWGYRSLDGAWAYCTRDEYAGDLPFDEHRMAYTHQRQGDCGCGLRHADGEPTKKVSTRVRIVATYDYKDEAGELLYQVVRYDPKGFKQRRPDGRGGWIDNLNGVQRVLYRLPELLAADPSALVFITEGEKDADNLTAAGLTATCSPMGAGKWADNYSEHLRARHVVILPDNDDVGRKHAGQVAQSLGGIAASVRVLTLPELPDKGDVSDWLAAGGTSERLQELATATEPLTQPGPCNLADLLDEIATFCARFIAYPDAHARVAHVLWLAHTHAMIAWDSTPRLAMLSPEPSSGKSRVLEVTELLVPRPVMAINVTPAYLFRKMGDPDGLPTVLYDEIDTVFGPKARGNEDIRGLLNAGHRKGAVAGRCAIVGKTVVTEEIPAYSAVALAGIGGLPDTIMSRSIVIRMKRRAPHEVIEPFRYKQCSAEGHALRDRLADWGRQARHDLTQAQPLMPEGVADRDADVWDALLTIADWAGGSWPERARCSAVAHVAAAADEAPTLGVRLLADIRTAFRGNDKLTTEELLRGLYELEEAPWRDLRGKPLNPRGLSNMLKRYGIGSKNIRPEADKARVVKGYEAADFVENWSRYLPPAVPAIPAQPATTATPLQAKPPKLKPYREPTKPKPKRSKESAKR